MNRVVAAVAASLVSSVLGVSSPAFAQAGGSFESLAEDSISLDELLNAARASVSGCTCLKEEAEKASCESAKEASAKFLKKGQKVRLAFSHRAIELGAYEEKGGRFPLALEGGVLAETDASSCPSTGDCADALESRGLAAPGTRIEVATPRTQTWSGFVTMSPEDAEKLEEVPSRLTGEAVFELAEWGTRSAEDGERSKWKSQQSGALNKEIADLKNQAKAAADPKSSEAMKSLLSQAQQQLACLGRAETKSHKMSVTLRPVGQRIFVRDPRFSGYLVSEPASSGAPGKGGASSRKP